MYYFIYIYVNENTALKCMLHKECCKASSEDLSNTKFTINMTNIFNHQFEVNLSIPLFQ